MRYYTIVTDSSCDLPAPLLEKMGIRVVPLAVNLDGKTYFNYPDGRAIGFEEYYAQLRSGKQATTSAVNMSLFRTVMEAELIAGHDVLYLGFSSGLSGTFNAGAMAARELQEEYPEFELIAVDTLCACMGQGLLVYLAALEKAGGKSMHEVRDFVEAQKLHICHWYTVDDLQHLKRGGRIGGTTARLGTMLNIKPVMHVDNDGHLINVSKARGRKALIWITKASWLPSPRLEAERLPSVPWWTRWANRPSSRKSRPCSSLTQTAMMMPIRWRR